MQLAKIMPSQCKNRLGSLRVPPLLLVSYKPRFTRPQTPKRICKRRKQTQLQCTQALSHGALRYRQLRVCTRGRQGDKHPCCALDIKRRSFARDIERKWAPASSSSERRKGKYRGGAGFEARAKRRQTGREQEKPIQTLKEPRGCSTAFRTRRRNGLPPLYRNGKTNPLSAPSFAFRVCAYITFDPHLCKPWPAHTGTAPPYPPLAPSFAILY